MDNDNSNQNSQSPVVPAANPVTSPVPAPSDSQVTQPQVPQPQHTQTVVMIVDDDGSMVRLYTNVFQIEGFNVVSASSGKEALEKLTTSTPSIILLDLMMPNMSGFDFLERIRNMEKTKDIPVIVLTNLATDDTQQEIQKYNVSKFLIKSDYMPKQILEEVKGVLASASLPTTP